MNVAVTPSTLDLGKLAQRLRAQARSAFGPEGFALLEEAADVINAIQQAQEDNAVTRTYRQALEIIGVKDCASPAKVAAEALVKTGFWRDADAPGEQEGSAGEDIRVARHAVFNLKEFRAGRSSFPGEALGILDRALDRIAGSIAGLHAPSGDKLDATVLADMRPLFEAWAASHSDGLVKPFWSEKDGRYIGSWSHDTWAAWQAALQTILQAGLKIPTDLTVLERRDTAPAAYPGTVAEQALMYRWLCSEAIYQQEVSDGWFEVKIPAPLQNDVEVTVEQFDAQVRAAMRNAPSPEGE